MATTDLITPCRTMTDLLGCLDADSHCVPTVEFTVRNFNLPINEADRVFLNQSEINLFSTRDLESTSTTAARPYATSRNLSDPTMTFDVPFVMMGLCIYAYGDPVLALIEGNQFYPQAVIDTYGQLPASPMNLRQNAVLRGGLFGAGAVPAGFTAVHPAQIEWGSPTWKAITAFLHAFRIEMRCPSSSYDLLMDEALADIGNCCSQVEWGGFGNTKGSHIRMVRNVNDRLNANVTAMPGGVDPGYFVPINCEQAADGEIVPQRYVGDDIAFGRPCSTPAVEQWYRLPVPIPFPSIPQPKLKITLKRAAGDEDYLTRMLNEMGSDVALNPIGGLAAGTFPTNDVVPGVFANEGDGTMTRHSAGQMRIGIGIKGFEVRQSVCEDLACMLGGKSYAELRSDPSLRYLTEQGGLTSGPYGGKADVCLPFRSGVGEPGGERR